MGLQVGDIDHQLIGLAALGREACKDAVEHAKPAPADEAVVDGLVRAVGLRRIAPAQPVADHEDNAADYALVVHARNTVESGK